MTSSTPNLPSTRTWSTVTPSLAIMGVSAGWALWPINAVDLSEHHAPTSDSRHIVLSHDAAARPVDLQAFRIPLWIAPPPPPRVPPPPPPPPPLTLQLLGVAIDQAGPPPRFAATLFDPSTGLLHVVRTGDSVGTLSVQSVSSDAIALQERDMIRLLRLSQIGAEGIHLGERIGGSP